MLFPVCTCYNILFLELIGHGPGGVCYCYYASNLLAWVRGGWSLYGNPLGLAGTACCSPKHERMHVTGWAEPPGPMDGWAKSPGPCDGWPGPPCSRDWGAELLWLT